MGRVQLVNSVILSMMVYSFRIYVWPASLLNTVDTWIRNFVWSGDINTRKIVTVAWNKVCKPFQDGGLGLRSIKSINKAGMLKLGWNLLSTSLNWALLLKARVFKNNKPVNYHVSSSIWLGIKPYISDVIDNSTWKLGNGININFWTDTWISRPIVDILGIPSNFHKDLKANLRDFIVNDKWSIPADLISHFPQLHSEIQKIVIPLVGDEDQLMWNHSVSGDLTFKESFTFCNPPGQVVPWTKYIWKPFIPPSKSFVIWRTLHNKMPTDDQLWIRGCNIVSVCSLCGKASESSHHLFLACPFAEHIWSWLGGILGLHIDTTSFQNILALTSHGWSPQLQDIVSAAIVNVLSVIWYCRNQVRFNNQVTPFHSAVNLIISNVTLAGNASKSPISSSIAEFKIIKSFNIIGNHRRSANIKEVNWIPPAPYMIKCNTDGAARGSPGPAACGGIFRDRSAAILGCFSSSIGINHALHAEIIGAMLAIEIAFDKGWKYFWLECDSQLVVSAFKNCKIVPWKLRNRWNNCLYLTRQMDFVCTHIYREGNTCADKLAGHGINTSGFIWWDLPPNFIAEDFSRNRYGLPSYRFC